MKKILIYAQSYFAYAKNRFPHLFKQRFLAIALAILLLLMVLTVANFSTPGSWLYPIKVNFLEKIESVFLFSRYSQSERIRALSGDRLSEAGQLLTKSELSKDKEVLLRNLFQDNAAKQNQAINSTINRKDMAGAVIIANRYEADLKGFENIFLKLRTNIDGASEQMDSLGANLDGELGRISKIRMNIETLFSTDENNTSFQTQSNKTIEETQNLISKTRLTIADKNKLLSADEVRSLPADLDLALGYLDQAKSNLKLGKFGTALINANQAYRYARATEVFLGFINGSR